MTRTRIVATLGPASRSPQMIADLIERGVDVFRLNFSHGTHEEHGETIKRIREAAGERPVSILQDLCGPKLRLDRPIAGKPGDEVVIDLPSSVEPGDPVLLADGAMQLEVIEGGRCRVLTAGEVGIGKGINLPSSVINIPSLTEKDRKDAAFGVEQGVDMIALSFVRRASDLDDVRMFGRPIIAKIEKAEAVERLEEIIAASDGVMVARGDLGVEIPIERVPAVQKKIIRMANASGKPVITATQMLRSMVESRMPTRAEATDVANAVIDGTDAVMLSEETAVGRHPCEAVAVMERILVEAEPLVPDRNEKPSSDPADILAHAACRIARHVGAKAIVVPTRSGFTARMIARFRPPMSSIALSPDEPVRKRLNLVWGVMPIPLPDDGERTILEDFREPVRATGELQAGDPVVMVLGWPLDKPGVTNLLHVTEA